MSALDGETTLKTGVQLENWQAGCTSSGGCREQLKRKFLASLLPLAVFVLALAPRLFDLGSKPFWWDEIATANRAALSLPMLVQNAFASHHTPVYFLLVAPLAHLPHPQFWLRLPSAILGALNVMLVFLIASRIGRRTAGFAASLVLGLSPTEIAFAQEARSYMLMIFFLLIALRALTGLAQSGERAALPWRTGGETGLWLQFIAGSAGAICTLGDSLPWLLAAILTAALMIARVRNRFGLFRNFLGANAIILACSMPLYILMQRHSVAWYGTGFASGSLPDLMWYNAGSVYLMRVCDFLTPHFMAVPTPRALTFGLGAGLAVAACGGIWQLRRQPIMAAILLPATFTLPVLFGVISISNPTLLLARYLLWSGSPFAILVGLGVGAALNEARPALRASALAATSVVLIINLMPYYRAETKPRWDIAARIFAAEAASRARVYYADPGGGVTMTYFLPAPLKPGQHFVFDRDLQHAAAARAAGEQIWEIYGDAWNRPTWESTAAFQASLAPLGPPNAVLHAGHRITMWRYDPTGN